MSQDRLPPPELEACLVRLRPSTQKGGTIIVEDVTDLATHERRLRDPDGYRPRFCPSCRETTLHVHDYRERVLRAEPGRPTVGIVRHECISCEAIWQILPLFLARCLWRTWPVVERTMTGAPAQVDGGPRRWPPVPERTQRRWRARWLRPARFIAQVLTSCGETTWAAVAGKLPPAATCADLVGACVSVAMIAAGVGLAAVAALVFRLQPSVRLM
jgi:hypothetical protein